MKLLHPPKWKKCHSFIHLFIHIFFIVGHVIPKFTGRPWPTLRQHSCCQYLSVQRSLRPSTLVMLNRDAGAAAPVAASPKGTRTHPNWRAKCFHLLAGKVNCGSIVSPWHSIFGHSGSQQRSLIFKSPSTVRHASKTHNSIWFRHTYHHKAPFTQQHAAAAAGFPTWRAAALRWGLSGRPDLDEILKGALRYCREENGNAFLLFHLFFHS